MNRKQIIAAIDEQIKNLQQARNALAGVSGTQYRTSAKGTRTLSTAAKSKIAAAQRKRWAKWRREKKRA